MRAARVLYLTFPTFSVSVSECTHKLQSLCLENGRLLKITVLALDQGDLNKEKLMDPDTESQKVEDRKTKKSLAFWADPDQKNVLVQKKGCFV